ncbi:MAG: hypothetical protein CMF48_03395 [Legionellales bacterium]|nr:hypothetical protein [Legionellales bacterium]|tara:strand:- start:352 stop:786 length:435 start_codon:yes stop_codon:yes gene_type:complete
MFDFLKSLFKSREEINMEWLARFVSAYAEGQQRAKINSALGSINVQLSPEDDNTQYSIQVSHNIVREILKAHGTNINETDEYDILAAGFLLFIVSNHISLLVGAPFEHVSSIAIICLLSERFPPDEAVKYVCGIGDFITVHQKI